MPRLILIRHGESQWNRENRFTGWTDVDLTDDGVEQMRSAAVALRSAGVSFDLAYSSVLRRCIRSQWILQDAMDCMWVPLVLDWRLNERHYGALTGLRKAEAIRRFGAEAVQDWRRSYDAEPPAWPASEPDPSTSDRRYATVPKGNLPRGESLRQTAQRVQCVWNGSISGELRAGHTVVITAHGNSLRALIKHLDGMSDEDVARLEVPNAMPLVYELDAELQPRQKHAIGTSQYRVSEIL